MKIFVWPYTKAKKNRIISDAVENNRSIIIHNPGRAVESFEYIQGEIREYIPSFEQAKEKFKDFRGNLHIFYVSDNKKSKDKVVNILKKNKITFTLSATDYPL